MSEESTANGSGSRVYEFNRAIVRTPAKSIVDGLRAGDSTGPDYDGVLDEHAAYLDALRSAGVDITVLPAREEYPDSMFVEDPALVLGRSAILLRPGAASRLGEAAAIKPDLERHFDTVIDLPGDGCADGGDVLVTSREVLIGLSDRTDDSGASALIAALATVNLAGRIVRTPPGVLHFKSDCSLLDEYRILATQRLAAGGVFDGYDVVVVPEGEEGAANALRINDTLMLSSGFPRTERLLKSHGYSVVTLATTEIQKVDAGLSCMSLRFNQRGWSPATQ